MAKAKRPPRKKQGFLPGMEPPVIQQIEDAAQNYYDVMMERVELSKQEGDAKQNLIDKMIENKTERYETADGLIVMVLSKNNVQCKRKKEKKVGDEESNGESNGEE